MSELMPPKALQQIRDMVDRWLVDTLEVWRGASVDPNENSLVDQHVAGTMIWSGKGRIRPTRGPREMPTPDGVAVLRECDILFALSSPEVYVDDEIHVASAADPQLTGRWFRLTDVRVFSQQPARKASAISIERSRLWPNVAPVIDAP